MSHRLTSLHLIQIKLDSDQAWIKGRHARNPGLRAYQTPFLVRRTKKMRQKDFSTQFPCESGWGQVKYAVAAIK